ncbi:eCIS core domain-containing protein [Roseateles amylovorans]|uniref:DUF4157 domain-containing protein n=1 Tax=Roseateles amylovorans TaxID=2978473 RepID=A0ABY6AW31_9BURK|nr:DUF4157 domain-containing protein [Roseateles amylovorans]UXH77381.1 DUF4157 domain-containing protein [Roseateles amylovorans]
MKDRHDPSRPAQREAAAAPPTHVEHGPVAAAHAEPIAQRAAPESDFSQSPRMLAQRRAIDAAFGEAAQRETGMEEEEPLQARMAPGGLAPVSQREEAPNLTGMPNQLKSGIESLSGMDMSDVRVHRNSDKPAQLNALAYAQGNDIHLASGQEQHLPHEAWHVVQQRQGRVQPTMQMAGTAINDDSSLESEADAMGAKATQLKMDDELDLG